MGITVIIDNEVLIEVMSMDIGKNYYSPTSEDLAVLYWWWITSSAWVIQVFLMAPAAVRSSWKYLHCISTCRLLYCLYLASSMAVSFLGAKDTYNGLKAFHTDCPLLFVELHCLEMCQLRMADLLELKRDIGQRDSAWREKRRRLLLTQQQLEGHHRRMQAPLGLALFINFVDILLAGYRLVGASRTPSEQLAIRAAILAAPAALKFARIWSICRGITGMENEVFELNIGTEKISLIIAHSGKTVNEEYYFKKQLHQTSMGLRIFGMFCPNNEFLFKVLATVATYVMVFYQFSVTPSHTEILTTSITLINTTSAFKIK